MVEAGEVISVFGKWQLSIEYCVTQTPQCKIWLVMVHFKVRLTSNRLDQVEYDGVEPLVCSHFGLSGSGSSDSFWTVQSVIVYGIPDSAA